MFCRTASEKLASPSGTTSLPTQPILSGCTLTSLPKFWPPKTTLFL
jgi:hypothetical protein